DRNRSHWSTSKTPSYTKSVSWQHHPPNEVIYFSMRPGPHFNNPWLENIAQWPTSKSDKKRQLRFI
ncbi:hypothetical protein ACNIV5_14800, partial [Escherichia coli]